MSDVGPDVGASPRWPEVIQLIGDTRTELGNEIKAVGEKLDKWIVPTGNRLTLVEATQAAHVQQFAEHRVLIESAHTAIGALRSRQESDEAATKALETAEQVADKLHEKKVEWWKYVVATAVLAIPGISLVHDIIIWIH